MFDFQKMVFPKPEQSYSKNSFTLEKTKLVYLPVKECSKIDGQIKREVPCLLMQSSTSPSLQDEIILYFHGNAEDLGIAYYFLRDLQTKLKCNILAVEYPGYGVYHGYNASQDLIEEDAQAVFIYLICFYKVPEHNIIVFGRSIGSGPACSLCSQYSPKALILMSPFTSIRDVAKQHVSFLSYTIKEQFANIGLAWKIECPSLVIHGKSDGLISHEQAQQLYQSLSTSKKQCHYPEQMTHNDFDFQNDLELPIKQFLCDLESIQTSRRKIEPKQNEKQND